MKEYRVFDAWAEQIDELEIPVDPASLTRAVSVYGQLHARLVDTVSKFDMRELWDLDGSTSMIAWLKARGLLVGDATTLTRTARQLRSFPTLAAASMSGELSQGQVKAILSCVQERHRELFQEHEPVVVPSLVGLSVDDTHKAMLHWREKAEALIERPLPPEDPSRTASLSQTLDGRWYLDGSFDAEAGAVIDTAIRVASDSDWKRLPGERRADAMVDIFRFFLDNQQMHPGPRHRPHVNIVINGDSIGTNHLEGEIAETRLPLDSPTLSRLLCDCALHRVLLDAKSAVLDYGLSTRTINSGLWNTLVLRDRHCRFPGCDRPPTWCEGHHVKYFSDGGPTRLDNLVLLCSKHHHRLHRQNWDARLEPDGSFVVRGEGGLEMRSRPPNRQPVAS
ncbi:MAG TPA: DUF222 domain-containing protein [Acidimicrobiales bacterium]|nr:DUF222 domain-containing protein [Acidimicrobiales bacterium]